MFEELITIDRELFLWLNGWHHPALDQLMIFFSAKLVWIPLYLFLAYYLFKVFKRTGAIYLLAVLLALAVTDQLTSSVMKPGFERLRPCHDPSLSDAIRVVDGCGGRFGFASGHAANSFMLAVFFVTIFHGRRYFQWMILWAALVAYSRVYLGVHFPGDILVGGLLGSLFGYGFARVAGYLVARAG